jgi:hypothetical protein
MGWWIFSIWKTAEYLNTDIVSQQYYKLHKKQKVFDFLEHAEGEIKKMKDIENRIKKQKEYGIKIEKVFE